jgi:hypothetical protein
MSTEIGDLTATGTILEESQSYKSDGSIVKQYALNTTDEGTFLALYNIGTSLDDGLVLGDINVRRAKGVTRATLTYVTPSTLSTKYNTNPDPIYSSDAAVSSVPIWQHPACDNPTGYETGASPKINGTVYPGVESYFVPALTYSKETFAASFTFSQSNIIDDVGSPESPAGMTGATAQQWLKVAKSVRQNGANYTINETWQHAGFSAGTANVWPSDIYGI